MKPGAVRSSAAGRPPGREAALVQRPLRAAVRVRLECSRRGPASVSLEAWRLMIQLLPGCQERSGQLFEKHCLPQTTLVFILCLLSGASSEMEHLRKSDPNSEAFLPLLGPPFQRQLGPNGDCWQRSAFPGMWRADRALSGNDLSLDLPEIK